MILEFNPTTTLLHLPLLIPGTISTGIIFAFTYIHPPTPFPNTFSLPLVQPLTPLQNCPALLFSDLVEEKT
jgi:hypothetical protein